MTNFAKKCRASDRRFLTASAVVLAGALCAATPAAAQHNGYGVDRDGDGNPATNVRGFFHSDLADTALNPPFNVVNFEPPTARHGDAVRSQYKKRYGVSFSDGLVLQACEGQQYFEYNSTCTYLKPPSGAHAALYQSDSERALQIRFDEPVCAASLAIYPTGGREGERFRADLTMYRTEDGVERKVGASKIDFTWTRDTFRWRSKLMAFLNSGSADRIDVKIRSRGAPAKAKPLRSDPRHAAVSAGLADELIVAGRTFDRATLNRALESAGIAAIDENLSGDDLAYRLKDDRVIEVASSIARARSGAGRNVAFLVDDVAFIKHDEESAVSPCRAELDALARSAPYTP